MLENDQPIVIFITCQDVSEAERISESLVQQHLIACGNILPGVRSIFQWKGNVEHDSEVLLIAKSRRAVFHLILNEVRKLHSYETPEIIALPIVEGLKEYLDWVAEETKTPSTE